MVAGLMGVADTEQRDGLNMSDLLTKSSDTTNGPSGRVVYSTHHGGRWTAAMDGQHKLVLSLVDDPWLFDLSVDPQELVNCYECASLLAAFSGSCCSCSCFILRCV